MKTLSTRRAFLQKGLCLLTVAPTIPSFLDSTVMALANPHDVLRTQGASGTDGKILVVVQMSGGNDGLSMVVPYADDAYQNARGGIAHKAADVLKLNDYIGLNGNLTGLKGLYDDGRMSVIQGVGYPNPNRSHFRSMDIWQAGDPKDERLVSGWLGRYFDNQCAGSDPKNRNGGRPDPTKGATPAENPVPAVAIGDHVPLAMQGEKVLPVSFESPDAYRYRGTDSKHYLELNDHPNDADHRDPHHDEPKGRLISTGAPTITMDSQLDFLTRTAMDAQLSSDKILKAVRNHKEPKPYPRSGFGEGLKTIAAMIAGGLPSRVYYVELGGFDTHANQLNRHDNLMKELGDGIAAFWDDLKSQENDDRVLMMTFSEFGRRVKANASGGTDHGTAAPMFLIGHQVASGVVGKHPSLTDLDGGDLKYGIDFRSVYSTVLERWLETPSAPILGQAFKPLQVLKA